MYSYNRKVPNPNNPKKLKPDRTTKIVLGTYFNGVLEETIHKRRNSSFISISLNTSTTFHG